MGVREGMQTVSITQIKFHVTQARIVGIVMQINNFEKL